MVGKVITGRYTGCSIRKLQNENVLIIEAENGNLIKLSKENVKSITEEGKAIDLSKDKLLSFESEMEQASSVGKKLLLIIWNDFETSVIKLWVSQSKPEKEGSSSNTQPNKVGLLEGCAALFIIIVILVGVLNMRSGNKIDNYPRGYEECFGCHGAGLVNEGFWDFDTCDVCGGSGMIDTHR